MAHGRLRPQADSRISRMTFYEFKMQEGRPTTHSEPVDCSDIVSRLGIAGIA